MNMLAAAGLLALAATGAQAGLSGTFQTQANDDGHVGMVEFYDCGGKTCGKLIKSLDKTGKEISSAHIGKNIVAGMARGDAGKFSGGTIWDPGSGKTYKSKMQLSGKTLNVSGCVAVFCRTQQWTRVE